MSWSYTPSIKICEPLHKILAANNLQNTPNLIILIRINLIYDFCTFIGFAFSYNNIFISLFPNENMKFDDVIEKRRSVRRFSSKKPKWQDIVEAIDAANKCPLAGNIYALRFILVDDKAKIRELAEASQQDFFENVDYAVVILSDKTSLIKSYDERAEMYARQQAGAAVENFLLKITEMGMASCWVGAFVDEEVKRVLEVPEPSDNIQVEAILPVGFEMPGHKVEKRKMSLDSCLWFNKWKNKFMTSIHKPDAS